MTTLMAARPRVPVPVETPERATVRRAQFVDHPLFQQPNAAARIAAMIDAAKAGERDSEDAASVPVERSSRGIRQFGVPLDAPLLTRAQEQAAFLRMNFLKWRAAQLQERVDRDPRSRGLAERVEALLAEADDVRNEIAVANLRLVVATARPFASAANPLDELFSECQASLLRSIELYDVRQGYSFSTYATHAIRNALGRSLERRSRQAQRLVAADPASLSGETDHRPDPRQSELRQRGQRQLVDRYLAILPDRERRILEARFGLDGSDEERTFREVGKLFGMSKERARVLANRALLRIQSVARAADVLE